MLGRVAHIPPAHSPPDSSIITVISELCRAADASGAKSIAVVDSSGGTRIPHAENVLISHPRASAGVGFSRRQHLVDFVVGALGTARPNGSRLYDPAAQALRARDVGAVLLHDDCDGLAALPRLAGLTHRPVVPYLHGDITGFFRKRELATLLRSAAAVVCVSSDLRERLLIKVGHRAPTVHVIPNGMAPPPRTLGERETPPTIVYLGRVRESKGVHDLIRACIQLAADGIEHSLRVIGMSSPMDTDHDRAYQAALRQLAAPIAKSTTFIPFAPRTEALEMLSTASIGCLPSTCADSSPLALGEMMSSGLAVVARRVGGVPELAGSGACLFSSYDELVRLLRRLLHDASELERWRIAAAAEAASNSWSTRWLTLAALVSSVTDHVHGAW